MNSLTPSATISLRQGTSQHFESEQRKKPDLQFVRAVHPNAAAHPNVGAGSNASLHDNNYQLIIQMMGSWWGQTNDAGKETKFSDQIQRYLTEEVIDAPYWHVSNSTLMANFALVPSIETLADRSCAAVEELTRLDPGWDGYNGVPVLPVVAQHALRLLKAIGAHTKIAPDVVPLSDGGLQLEWYVGIHEIEVEIAPDCATRLHRECIGDGCLIEVPIVDPLDVSKVAAYFRALRH